MIGRGHEASRVADVVEAARAGRSGALLVTGEPGIGKTLLLDHAREAAAGMRVLSAAGSEGEGHLAFAGLADLLGPVLGAVDRIPEPQADALRGALALGPPAPGDRFTTYAGGLSLLAAAAEERPVLCLVDDAHWLDAGSLEAVLFVARRVRAEGIAVLIAARPDAERGVEGAGLPRLDLAPLSADAAADILERNAPVPPAPAVRDALVRGAGGNPLALVELARALTPDQLTGRDTLPRPLPVGRYLERALLRPLAQLPARTRRALLLVSADDGAADLLAGALAAEGLGLADLEAAERAGVVVSGPARTSFSHPLVRAAVYHAATPPDRRSAHAALAASAGAAGEAGALDRRAWHLALASAGPDEGVAAELEAAAQRAGGRNAYAAATEALVAAAHLTPDAGARVRRLSGAARAAAAGGAMGRAAALLDEVTALPGDPAQAMEARIARAHVEMFGGSVRRATDMLVSAADAVRESAPVLAATLLAQATAPAQLRGDIATTLALAERASALGAGAPPAARAVIAAAVAGARTYHGHAAALPPGTEDELARGARAGDPMALFWAVAVVQFHVLNERYDDALERLDGFVAAARARSAPSALPFPLCLRADVLQRLGRLHEARADAAEAAQVADETGQAMMVTFAYGTLARVAALLGRADECRAHARRAVADVAVSKADLLLGYAEAALGLLAIGEGRVADAAAHLAGIERRLGAHGAPHPLIIPFEQDLAEARIRLGRADDARRGLDALAAAAGASGGA